MCYKMSSFRLVICQINFFLSGGGDFCLLKRRQCRNLFLSVAIFEKLSSEVCTQFDENR
jgi:hypothetical protein